MDNEHETECPRNLCSCDKEFVTELLTNYKKCKKGEKEYCQNEDYYYTPDRSQDPVEYSGFNPETDCGNKGITHAAHKECCGTYPFHRQTFPLGTHECCDDTVHKIGECVNPDQMHIHNHKKHATGHGLLSFRRQKNSISLRFFKGTNKAIYPRFVADSFFRGAAASILRKNLKKKIQLQPVTKKAKQNYYSLLLFLLNNYTVL